MTKGQLKLRYVCVFLFGSIMLMSIKSEAQHRPVFKELASIPHTEGYAGMFAGLSKGNVFCAGGANFPDKRPWEGGKKKWYDEIYMLQEGKSWIKLKDKLPSALGYGVAVSYKDQFILIGGNNENGYSDKVFGYEWRGVELKQINYPKLPVPLANMTGAVVGRLLMLAGGNTSATGKAEKLCYGLDLEAASKGWFMLPSIPGRERLLPMSGVYNGQFFLFGGEATESNSLKQNYRRILDDAYCFKPEMQNGKWTGTWTVLSRMPKGLSAAGSPLPILEDGEIVFWGGVDALTALHTDPVSHPGISADIQLYNIHTDSWKYAGKAQGIAAPVTLPVVNWKGGWLFISGEIKPGIRTNKIYELK